MTGSLDKSRRMPDHTGAEHDHWSEPLNHWTSRISFGRVAITWVVAAAISIVLSIVFGLMLSNFATNGARDASESGLFTIAGGFATFLGFFIACLVVLRGCMTGRFMNAMAVAALHLIVLGGIVLGSLVSEVYFGTNPATALPAVNETFELGVGFFSLERSAVTAIAACLIAAALMPSSGRIPKGTQYGAPSEDRTL